MKPSRRHLDLPPEKIAGLSLWKHVRKTDSCWLWTGTVVGRYPYPRCHVTGYGYYMAHRAIYELLVGPIPDGLTLDHLCRTPMCVNPDHLEPVTLVENLLRGDGPPAQNARKTHCKRGHPFTGDNFYVGENQGARICRPCRRLRVAANRQRAREAA